MIPECIILIGDVRADGRFRAGERRSIATEFKPGQHWRPHQPFRDKQWLEREYLSNLRSASEIGAQFGVGDTAIHFWLKKHGIKTRTVSECRAIKHWGQDGDKNPMFGKRGAQNPCWRGGLTPLRQHIYASLEWKRVARKVRHRDKCCRLCGESSGTEIHHIDPFSKFPLLVLEESNLILLCGPCHKPMFRREHLYRHRLMAILAAPDEPAYRPLIEERLSTALTATAAPT